MSDDVPGAVLSSCNYKKLVEGKEKKWGRENIKIRQNLSLIYLLHVRGLWKLGLWVLPVCPST